MTFSSSYNNSLLSFAIDLSAYTTIRPRAKRFFCNLFSSIFPNFLSSFFLSVYV